MAGASSRGRTRMLTRAGVALAAILAWAGVLGLHHWRTRGLGPVERGWRVASSRGCFGCHGPAGLRGLADPGADIGGVPTFAAEDVRAYARTEAEIREWILDGVPRRLREEQPAETLARGPLLRMPAWRGVLSAGEVQDLVAWIKAVSDFETPGEAAEAGRAHAARLGCFSCHGPQGRGTLPNPGSFKGYIPAWVGADLGELARDESELREWILDGSPRRLREHFVARFFLGRQVVKMPGYRGRITDEELQAIVGYIAWLRRGEEL